MLLWKFCRILALASLHGSFMRFPRGLALIQGVDLVLNIALTLGNRVCLPPKCFSQFGFTVLGTWNCGSRSIFGHDGCRPALLGVTLPNRLVRGSDAPDGVANIVSDQ